MTAGFLLLSIVSGLTAFASALVLGKSVLFAFASYAVIGTVFLVLVPLTYAMIRDFWAHRVRHKTETETYKYQDLSIIEKETGRP